jgi:hypothetical protein
MAPFQQSSYRVFICCTVINVSRQHQLRHAELCRALVDVCSRLSTHFAHPLKDARCSYSCDRAVASGEPAESRRASSRARSCPFALQSRKRPRRFHSGQLQLSLPAPESSRQADRTRARHRPGPKSFDGIARHGFEVCRRCYP